MSGIQSMFVGASACAALLLVVVPLRPVHAQPCTTLPPAPAVEPVSVNLALMARDKSGLPLASYTDAQSAALVEVLQHLQSVLRAPPAVPPPDNRTRFAEYDSSARLYVPDVAADFTFVLGADARITKVDVEDASISASADSLLVADLQAASGAAVLTGLASVFGSSSVRLELFTTFRRDRRPGSVRWVQAPFYKTSLPVYRGTPVSVILPAMGPRYPYEKLKNAEFGEVLASFVVGADSVAQKRSIRILQATDTDFGNAIRSWLPTLRYRPLMLNGCPVPSRVQQPNRFSPRPEVR